METYPSVLSLQELADLAIGTPEVGAVNFNLLHMLIVTLLKKLNLHEALIDFRSQPADQPQLLGSPRFSVSAPSLTPVKEKRRSSTRLAPQALDSQLKVLDRQVKDLDEQVTGFGKQLRTMETHMQGVINHMQHLTTQVGGTVLDSGEWLEEQGMPMMMSEPEKLMTTLRPDKKPVATLGPDKKPVTKLGPDKKPVATLGPQKKPATMPGPETLTDSMPRIKTLMPLVPERLVTTMEPEKSVTTLMLEKPQRAAWGVTADDDDVEVRVNQAMGMLHDVIQEVQFLKENLMAQELKPQMALEKRIENLEKQVKERSQVLDQVGQSLSIIPPGEEVTMVTWEELEHAITDGLKASLVSPDTATPSKHKTQSPLASVDLSSGSFLKRPSFDSTESGPASEKAPGRDHSRVPSSATLPVKEQHTRTREESALRPHHVSRLDADRGRTREQHGSVYPRRDERDVSPGLTQQDQALTRDQPGLGYPDQQGVMYLSPQQSYLGQIPYDLGSPAMDQTRLVYPGTYPSGVVPPSMAQRGMVPLDMDQQGVLSQLETPGTEQHGVGQFVMDQHGFAPFGMDQRGLVVTPFTDHSGTVPPSLMQAGTDQQALVQPRLEAPDVVQPDTQQRNLVPPGAVQYGLVQPGTVQRGLIAPGAAQHGLLQPTIEQHGVVQPGAIQHGLTQTGLVQPGPELRGLVQSGLVQPGTDQRGLVQPGLLQPGTDQRAMVQPGLVQPGTDQRGMVQPGLVQPGTDQRAMVQPGLVQPSTDQHSMVQPGLVQPGADQRAMVQPGIMQPGADQRAMVQPGIVQPGADQRAMVQPGFMQPGSDQRGMVQPGLVQPGTDQRGMVQPGLVQPGTDQRGMVQPGLVQPGADQSAMVQPGLVQPGADQRGMFQPGLVQPGADQRGMVQPGIMQPGTDQRGMIQPGLIQPGTDQHAMVQPGLVQPGADQRGMFQPGLVQPGADQHDMFHSGFVQPGGDQHGMVQPGLVQPGADQRGIVQPGLVQPGADQHGMVQPGLVHPGLLQPSADQHGLVQPGLVQPGTGQGGVIQPGMMEPGIDQRGMIQPGLVQPGLLKPGADQRGMVHPGLVQPATDQHGLVQPGLVQPGLLQPGADQHGVVQPSLMQPGTDQHGVIQPGLVQPGTDQHGMVQPGLIQPGIDQHSMIQTGLVQPGLVQPGADQHGVVQPGLVQPGLDQPGLVQPGLVQPGADQRGVVQPGLAQPGVDQHSVVQPGLIQHGLLQPGAYPPGVVQSGTYPPDFIPSDMDQHSFVQPSADEHGLMQPGAGPPGLAQPGAGPPGLAQPGAGLPGLVQPGAGQHGLVQPGPGQPSLVQLDADQPGLVQPGTDQPGLVQPGADQPGLVQPGPGQHGLLHPGPGQPGFVQPGAGQRGLVQPGVYLPSVGQSGTDQFDSVQRGLVGPGIYPPGPVQPGVYPPGSVRPGIYPPGPGQPSTYLPGLVRPGTYPPGLVQPGIYPPGLTRPGIYPPGLVRPGVYPPGLVRPGAYPGLVQPGAYPPGPVQRGAYPPALMQPGDHPRGLIQPSTYLPGLVKAGAYPSGSGQRGEALPGVLRPGIHPQEPVADQLHGLGQQGLPQPDTGLRDSSGLQVDSSKLPSPRPYQQGVLTPGRDRHAGISLLDHPGLESLGRGQESLKPLLDQKQLELLGPDQRDSTHPESHDLGYLSADQRGQRELYPDQRGQTAGQDTTLVRKESSDILYVSSSEMMDEIAVSETHSSLEKLAPVFPMAVETFRMMGELIGLYLEIKEKMKDLDDEQAGQTDLEKLQYMMTLMVKKNIPTELQEELKNVKSLAKEIRQEKAKLDRLQRILEGEGARDTGKEVKPGQLGLQLAILRVTVADIKKELAELKESQQQGKISMEHSVSEASLYLQDQLDKLRVIIENMLASSSTLLSMSMPPSKTQVINLSPSQIDPEATCPACSLDVGHQVSLLVQRYEQLQDMVNNLAASRPSKKTKLQSQDEELLGRVQSAILQVQGDCEKLISTTSSLIEDHRQKQKDIDVLYQGLEKLEREKANREQLEMEIDVKADKSALASKVSRIQFDTTTEQLNHMMRELVAKMSGQEQDWQRMLDKLLVEMDNKLDRLELDPVKQLLEERWKSLRQQLKERPPLDQADEAAILRRQLLAHFHCLSCDRPLETLVTGQIIPVTPVGPGLPGHRSTRPYTVFELEQIRQQGRNLKMGSVFPRVDLAQLERSVGRLRTMHSKMLKDIEKVQIHFGGSVKASSQMIRELLQAQCLHSPCYKRVPDSADYTYSSMPRRCGGSHTLTYPYRRSRLQHPPQSLHPTDDIQVAMKHDEVDILGLDGHIYKGRMDTKLPGILTKDYGAVAKHKSKQSRLYMQRLQSRNSNKMPSRPQSAHIVATHTSAPSRHQKDRPVSSEGRLSQSNMVHLPSPTEMASLLADSPVGLEKQMTEALVQGGVEEPTRGPRSTSAD